MSEASAVVQLSSVTKRFEQQEVLREFSLSIHDGEFFTILGPSGCGKTTILRLIAGFEHADSGQVIIDGTDVSTLGAEKRSVNTVFQSYALFPHLTVFENVAFGLRMARVARTEIESRVKEVLEMVQLGDFAQRRPEQLSGGQRQRVAIARAVVNRPKVLLLDESLSALDYQLRLKMQSELKHLQRQLGITFVYVTHDQEEALSMSDRILVMHQGQPQQVGTPRQIYESPRNLFVASFIGETNVLNAKILRALDDYRYEAELEGRYQRIIHADRRYQPGDDVHVLLRPEDLRIEYLRDAGDKPGFVGEVKDRNYTGRTLDSIIELPDGLQLRSSEFFDEDDPDFDYSINERVWVDWVHGWEHVIPAENLNR